MGAALRGRMSTEQAACSPQSHETALPAARAGQRQVFCRLLLHAHFGGLLLVIRVGVDNLLALHLAEHRDVRGNGVMVGRISSGMFGHTIGKSLGMGYVENAGGLADRDFVMGGHYEIEVAGVRAPADASMSGPYDPARIRIKDAGNAPTGSAPTG